MTNPAIDEILASFDFDKVHRVMLFLHWQWMGVGGLAVPSAARLQAFAATLLADVKDGGILAGGGLRAERQGSWYHLSFVLTDWDAWSER